MGLRLFVEHLLAHLFVFKPHSNANHESNGAGRQRKNHLLYPD